MERPTTGAPAQSESDINSTALRAAAELVLYGALSRALSFKTTMGNVLTLTLPLTLTDAQLDRALDILEACLADERAGRA